MFKFHSTSAAGLEARIGIATDLGMVRHNNEDRVSLFDLKRQEALTPAGTLVLPLRQPGILLVVADGMGGMVGGELASQMCIELLPAYLLEQLDLRRNPTPAERSSALAEAVRQTNQMIYGRASSDPQLGGMGTTVTGALLDRNHLYIAQVGDSRAYMARAGVLEQLTKDQTVWDSLGDSAEALLTEETQWKNVLTQAVGALPAIEVAITETAVMTNDWLLLCTDGLHRVVDSEEMSVILQEETSPAEKALELIARANQRGGPDNISVIVCQVASTSGRSE